MDGSMLPVPVSSYDTKRELNKGTLELWDKEKGKPSLGFEAVEQLLACHGKIVSNQLETLEALHVEVTPLRELSERPETEPVMEELVKMSERPNSISERLLEAQGAIHLIFEALSQGLGGKLQKAFDRLQGDQWPRDVTNLRFLAMALATELQRPRRKAERKKRYDPDGRIDPSTFAKLLRHAGLSWLPRGSSTAA